MKSLKKTTLLVIASIALLTPQQKIGAHWAEDLIKGAAVCATIATGACLIGGGIYLACQPLSDSQEISRAENLYSDAQSKNDYLSSTYARELELFEFIPYTNQKNRIIIDIKSEIQSHYNAYAFMNFQDKLDSNIYSLDSMISSISSKENHLAERKNQLFSKENKLSYSERNKYAQEYDDLCNQLNSSHYILTQLRDRLYQLYCLVITFPECKKDKGLYKIHQLEKKVRKLENDINHPNSYYCNFSNYGYTASFAKINARIDYLKTRIKKLKIVKQKIEALKELDNKIDRLNRLQKEKEQYIHYCCQCDCTCACNDSCTNNSCSCNSCDCCQNEHIDENSYCY